ncbi:hypothetical protein [Spirochaeta africana]|uniref:Uncharacterized protein n=1 Tax=Spirochaeta africana (strain ATCC 700263 / DSM 8902 / Z-7692) TaxID=889378 RepID=H9UKT4_SPIAZ|nr:hypothetical protein [Spirochaeta africana]AFG38127.1 hypothetical protein Spiaf_2079 [Spirochaeta africana DSM 8902]
MSIQPIDLQTLFARLDDVGRNQSSIRNAEIHNQEAVGREIEQKTALKSRSVQESEEIQDGPEKVHDDDEAKQDRRHSSSRHKRDQDDEDTEAQLRDPNLGRNIDFSG